ncbi:MAG: Gfo/Idh/MocA family oxidoreductase [Ktedonobacteraceae bacterium]|nr:Gfo/Idh/MocA family oxidoreductase [Ktedonobacteraceae bacterium]
MVPSKKEHLRVAVVGAAAGVFSSHRPGLELPEVELVAVTDINSEAGQQRAREQGCAFYADAHEMLEQEHPDIVVIMTPHPFHARIAIDSLRAGSHVLVEKPMAVQVAEADMMIETAAQHERLLGVVFQQRFRSEIRTARTLIQQGKLGDIQRVELTASWTRPASYFKQAPWRGTWAGEGGGILINQAAHNLDILCSLVGVPQRVYAWNRRLLHRIETEDTAHALLEYANGALGFLHISTAESDEAERLKIVGTGGRLEIRQGILSLRELKTDLKDFVVTSPSPYAAPASHEVQVEYEAGQGTHTEVYRAFYDALLHGTPFPSTGEEGRKSLELANSLIYSHYTHSEVTLPLDRQKYAALLTGLKERHIS